jgi:diguanylate cyclase with GGDEF domain
VGAATADALRESIASEPVDGLALTMSFGVAAADVDERFEFNAVFDRADSALYAAKAQGRNCIRVAETTADKLVLPVISEATEARPVGGLDDGAFSERRARQGSRMELDMTPLLAEVKGERMTGRAGREGVENASWLVRDEAARTHMLDMLHRLRHIRMAVYGIVLSTLIAAGPFYGWLPIVPPLLGAVVLAVVIDRSAGQRRPEFAIGAAILISLVANAAGFVFAHGMPYVALPFLVLSVFAWSPVFPARGVAVAAAIDVLLIVAAAVLVGGHQAFSDPAIIGVPLALLTTVALIGSGLGRSAIDYRDVAVVDQLSGMLNRRALESRIALVTQQSMH